MTSKKSKQILSRYSFDALQPGASKPHQPKQQKKTMITNQVTKKPRTETKDDVPDPMNNERSTLFGHKIDNPTTYVPDRIVTKYLKNHYSHWLTIDEQGITNTDEVIDKYSDLIGDSINNTYQALFVRAVRTHESDPWRERFGNLAGSLALTLSLNTIPFYASEEVTHEGHTTNYTVLSFCVGSTVTAALTSLGYLIGLRTHDYTMRLMEATGCHRYSI